MNTPYTEAFYAGQSDRSLMSARVVLGALFESLHPASVIDVGCGVGPWLRAAQELGATDVLGIDGDYVDRTALMISPSEFAAVNLETQRVHEVSALATGRRFDLVISVEVAEHLSFARADGFVDDLTSLGDTVLFSAAVPFQGGEHHVNEQWPEFWAMLFRARGFECVDAIRPLVWARDDVDWWYAQNALLFVRRDSAAAERAPRVARPAIPPLAMVHPSAYLDQVLKWFHTFRLEAAAEELADLQAVVNAYHAGSEVVPTLQAVTRAATDPDRPDVFPNTRIARCFPESLLREQQTQLDEANRDRDELRRSLRQTEAVSGIREASNRQLKAELAALQLALKRELAISGIRETSNRQLRAALAAQRSAAKPGRDGAPAGSGSADALRLELEARLVEIRETLTSTVADSQRQIAELEHTADTLRRRVAELERSRLARLAKSYYDLYSLPVLGAVLHRLRRTVGNSVRWVRSTIG